MKLARPLSLLSVWLVSAGCQTVTIADDRAARIVNADADSRAALQAAVDDALGIEVMLRDDALIGSSLLTIERWTPGTMNNPVPEGRILDKPIQFRLVINGPDCILIDQRDGSRRLLHHTTCKAE